MKYLRPDIETAGKKFSELINDFKNAGTFEEEENALMGINELRNDFKSMHVIASINYSNDTDNKNFSDEQDYFDTNGPLFESLENEYYKVLLDTKFRKALEDKYGKQLLRIAKLVVSSFDPTIVDDLQIENHLESEYTKLVASARIIFQGKERNLQELLPFMESSNRETRKNAFDAYWNFFLENKEHFDNLFDKLVSLRNGMAQKLGNKNFVEMGYARMKRSDYNPEMVKQFRKNVLDFVVPLASKLREKQQKRLGVEKLMAYDIPILFKSGNAVPKGDPEWIMEKGKKMYAELSPVTSDFYNFMLENDLMDVYCRKGKAAGGFCEFIPEYKSPYIFSNMNGTHEDISVLTHEAGHAFQVYMSRHFEVLEYFYSTLETAEIHSMSMEYLTYPWMDLFFDGDTEKFKFLHLNDTITFLPYGVLVDEFQHWVYENPLSSPQTRKLKWRELEKIYMPHLDYGDNQFLSEGGRWQRQAHIYESPFYYIDYCLAQVCAFQFWLKAIRGKNGDFKSALEDYIKLCSEGGSRSFLELVKFANLKSPFEEEVLKQLTNEIEMYLDSIDEKTFN